MYDDSTTYPDGNGGRSAVPAPVYQKPRKVIPGDQVTLMDETNLSHTDLRRGKVYTISDTDIGKIMLAGKEHFGWIEASVFEFYGPKSPSFIAAKEVVMYKKSETTATTTATTLPPDSNERKDYPLFRGLLRYFPAALAGVAKTSKLGNDKHNPGEEMHHARGKSADQGDCILRHLMDVEDLLAALNRGETELNGIAVKRENILNEVNQMAWRALAFSQELHEQFGAPLAPGAKK